ncbi:hypothetical protein H0H92_014562 [Tricholoma furcatifolium]|nr:hypothetical protein H0H92_014562 [Tricholoma furcatifolium]
MDSLQYANTPRTPSPHNIPFFPHDHYKHQPIDMEPRIYEPSPNDDDGLVVPVDNQFYPQHFSSRGSLLQELYDHDLAEQQQQQSYLEPEQPAFHQQHENNQWNHQRHHEYHMTRRATFPYVRHDRDDGMVMHQYPPFIQHHDSLHPSYPARPDALYADPISEAHEFMPSMTNSPHQSYHEFDENPAIKLEDTGSIMVPSQPGFYNRPPSSGPCHPMNMTYISPHTGLPVQHTDDAASKETQYLRRRCFNCHTTEPPSWRRSTLNPGKIVCNKCGLYERTHLRPRPLRFDELRAGNKARTNKTKGAVSPKAKATLVKKEPREFGLVRRSSVSSASSVHSGSGASDWDDNVSIYSSGSAPPTSFNSPDSNTFSLDRDSQSPPLDGGIRLPNAPLCDLGATIAPAQAPVPPSPGKANTVPLYTSPGSSGGDSHPGYFRHGSISESQPEWPLATASPQSLTASLEIALPSEDVVVESSLATATPASVAVAAAS